MIKNTYLAIAFFSFLSNSIAQIPELNVLISTISKSATGIEKARQLYNNGDYITAEAMLYIELEKGNFTPNDFLLFANTLNLNNKIAKAREFYLKYAKTTGKVISDEQISELFSSNINYPANRVITEYPVTNPTVFQDKLYAEVGGLMMMYSQDCEGNLENRTEVMQGITDMPFGSISYFDNGNKAVASIISIVNNRSSLYMLHKKNEKWEMVVKLFDSKNNYAFPHMDVATNTLYFSSDKEGGYGGYDVYNCRFNGKDFSNSVNMGDQLNSPGNDINPTLTEDWLYISSNGHASKGGYDLYKYKKTGNFNTLFLNCTELNTLQNELSLVPQIRGKFLINREEDGENRLLSINIPKVLNSLSGNVIDEKGNGVANAYVIMDPTDGMGIFAVTDVKGNFIYKSEEAIDEYEGKIVADGYESKYFNTTSNENLSVQLIKFKPVEIVKIEQKQIQTQLTPITRPIQKENTSISSEVESASNEVNVLGYNDTTTISSSIPNRDLYYIIIGSTYNYAKAYEFRTTWFPSFNSAEILEYDNGLYRIGFYAGSSEEKAMQTFRASRVKKKDVWILRPKN